MHSRLLEAAHAVQDVELLPPFGEIHFAVNIVWVPQVHEGEVLQDEPPGRMESPVTSEVTQKAAAVQAGGMATRTSQR